MRLTRTSAPMPRTIRRTTVAHRTDDLRRRLSTYQRPGMRAVLVAAVLVFVAPMATAAATSDGSEVCDFTMAKLYVRDSTQTMFPAGFLPCLNEDESTHPRCHKCSCRERHASRLAGKKVIWGVCLDGAKSCSSAQAPHRHDCGPESTISETDSDTSHDGESESSSEADPEPEPTKKSKPKSSAGDSAGGNSTTKAEKLTADTTPGTVKGSGKTTSAPTTTPATSAPAPSSKKVVTEQTALGAQGDLESENKGGAGKFIVVGIVIAGLVGAAVFVVAKRRQEKELSTPRQENAGAYKDNDTSKATSNAREPQFHPQANQSAAYGYDQQGQSMHQGHHPPPMETHDMRNDLTSSSDDEEYDEFTNDGTDNVNGPAAFGAFDEVNGDMQTTMSIDFLDDDEDDDDYDESEDEGGDYPRDSEDSVLMSTGSSLSFYDDESSPRSSIEF